VRAKTIPGSIEGGAKGRRATVTHYPP
jgi:hypothetical protein